MTKKKRKDIVKELDSYTVADKLASDCMDRGLNVFRLDGCLVDSYAIDNSEGLVKFGRIQRDYVIIRETYLNEWSSTLMATFTDNEDLFDEFFEEWREAQEEDEEAE